MTHPTRQFEGTLLYVDQPSEGVPKLSNQRRRPILIPRLVALAALDSLLGTPLRVGRHYGERLGRIEEAWIFDSRLVVRGTLDAYAELPAGPLGMSFEATNAHIEDLRRTIFVFTRLTFKGALVAPLHRVAYKGSSFSLIEPNTVPQPEVSYEHHQRFRHHPPQESPAPASA